MPNWRDDLEDIGKVLKVTTVGNWRIDLKAIRDAVVSGGGGSGGKTYTGLNTPTLSMLVNNDADVISADVILSTDEYNSLEARDGGLYCRATAPSGVEPTANAYVTADNKVTLVPPSVTTKYPISAGATQLFKMVAAVPGKVLAKNTYELSALFQGLETFGRYRFEIDWYVTTPTGNVEIAKVDRAFETFYVNSDVLYTPLITVLANDVSYEAGAIFTLSIKMTEGNGSISLVTEALHPVTIVRNGAITLSTSMVYGTNPKGEPATQKEINESVALALIKATLESVASDNVNVVDTLKSHTQYEYTKPIVSFKPLFEAPTELSVINEIYVSFEASDTVTFELPADVLVQSVTFVAGKNYFFTFRYLRGSWIGTVDTV